MNKKSTLKKRYVTVGDMQQAQAGIPQENSSTLDQEKNTMLNPIRQELDLGPDIYESLDEDMIDVTQERIEEARIKSTPFDHGRLSAYFERFKEN